MDQELLQALELAKQGAWDASHEIVQSRGDKNACRIHAYLHRVEGDHGNARYWYNRAGASFPEIELDDELQELFQLIGGAAD